MGLRIYQFVSLYALCMCVCVCLSVCSSFWACLSACMCACLGTHTYVLCTWGKSVCVVQVTVTSQVGEQVRSSSSQSRVGRSKGAHLLKVAQ